MNPARVEFSAHALERAQERCRALAGQPFEALERALREALARGAPWGRSDKAGPRHYLVELGGERFVVGLTPSRHGPFLVAQTVLTLAQAQANAAAWPGAVSGRFKSRIGGRRYSGGRR